MKCYGAGGRRATEFGLSGSVFRTSFTGIYMLQEGFLRVWFLKSTQDTEVIAGTAMQTSKHIHCFALIFGNASLNRFETLESVFSECKNPPPQLEERP